MALSWLFRSSPISDWPKCLEMSPISFPPSDGGSCTDEVRASQWSWPLTWRLYRSFSFGRQWSTRHVTLKNSDIWGFIILSNVPFGFWGCWRCIFWFFFSFTWLVFGRKGIWCWVTQLYLCTVIRVNAGRWGKKYRWNGVYGNFQKEIILRVRGLGGGRWIWGEEFIGTWDGNLQRIKRIFIILAPILISFIFRESIDFWWWSKMNQFYQKSSAHTVSRKRTWFLFW